jgi:hypothetical protein
VFMLKNITLYIPLHTANVMSDCPRATQNPETFVMQRNLVTRPLLSPFEIQNDGHK